MYALTPYMTRYIDLAFQLGPPPSAQPSAADYGVACLAEGKDGGPLVLRPGRPGGPPRSLGP